MTCGGVPYGPPAIVRAGDLAIVHCTESFTFDAGNPLRLSNCLMCDDPIGGQPAAVIGAAALAGPPCHCGSIVSDVFLIHAGHLPASPEEIAAAIRRGLLCSNHAS